MAENLGYNILLKSFVLPWLKVQKMPDLRKQES